MKCIARHAEKFFNSCAHKFGVRNAEIMENLNAMYRVYVFPYEALNIFTQIQQNSTIHDKLYLAAISSNRFTRVLDYM